MGEAGPQVGDDMTVEVALSVMAGARSGHLLVRDDDGRCTGLLTEAQLVAVRDGSAYTDRVRLREIAGDRGPFTSPLATMAEAEHSMRRRRVGALPVVDEHGCALGVLTLAP
ncbi:CBS domain-containing protein [Streptomyces sp. NPDC053755]|uniref:CBS domain-containing protein n=1 Tax=Streptomyces sp. NPDC053755 TaxID=3155815 RepID=UPI0034459251